MIWYQYKITQYQSVNVNLSNPQYEKLKLAAKNLNKLKPETKNNEKVTLRLSLNLQCNVTNENNFWHRLLLTNRQVSSLCKAFADNSSDNKNYWKQYQIYETIKLGGFLGRTFAPLIKTGLPLMKTVFTSLAKCFLIPLGSTAAESAAVKKK